MANRTLLSVIAALSFAQGGYSESLPARQIPHYLRDVPTAYDNEVDRLVAKQIAYSSLIGKYPGNPPLTFFNGAITTVVDVHGQQVEFVFKNYRKEVSVKDAEKEVVAHYSLAGREELTVEEFELVKNDIIATQREASLFAYQGLKQTKEKVVQILEKQLKQAGLLGEKETLESKLLLEAAPGITVQDAMHLPDIILADFVPKKLVFGPIPALGVTYLNTGWVFYDPKARALDYMDKIPNTLIHELQHRNHKLQRMPYVWSFNAETLANLSIIEQGDAVDFMLHPYYEDVRHLSKVLFGFDSQRGFQDAFFVLHGGITADCQKMEKYIAHIKKISGIIHQTAMEEFIPEYYAHFTFWSTVNQKLQDKNAALKLFFYMKYEPTQLGGPQPTRKWLEKNKAVIEEASRKALNNLRDEKKDIPRILNEKEFMAALRHAGIHVENIDPDVIYELYVTFNRGLGQ